MSKTNEIILITGGSGFLGQHIIKTLQETDSNVTEIRVVDLIPYKKKLDHLEPIKIKSFIGNICDANAIEKAFDGGVNCVFHCAAYVNFQCPPDLDKLEDVNVNGTKNVINLCVKYNICHLVYTSSAIVSLIPYMGRASFSIIVNQTESKANTPSTDKGFLIKGYSSTKLRAEKIVLGANGTNLPNGTGELLTVALRPTLMYGEEDHRFFTSILKITTKFNGKIPKLFGQGGKHQLTYVGNAAWAHVRAKETLKKEPGKINGLPIFITDDTPIEDTTRFCQRISRSTDAFKLEPTWWSIPSFFTYFMAILLELLVTYILHPIFKFKLQFSPRGIAAYAMSLIMYSRLRASIHLDYEPIYNEEKSIMLSAKWYEKWYNENLNNKIDKKQK